MLFCSILWWYLLWGCLDNVFLGKCVYSNLVWFIKEWKGLVIVCGIGRLERMLVWKNWRYGRMESCNVCFGSCL